MARRFRPSGSRAPRRTPRHHQGSFYHHFENRDSLIIAALADWERSQTEAVIQRLDLIPDPAERLRAVMAAAIADRAGGGTADGLLSDASPRG
ncbi:MAG: hypothetical protein M3Y73_03065 [Actinomycetota bacterium]|nr:hypothetical protein [Actinomycetota bacterium]